MDSNREGVFMARFDYKTFYKRYDKFKNNNLPTPFWDKERQVLEYVFYKRDDINVYSSLNDSFSDIAYLYFPFNSVIYTSDGGRKIGKCHEHSFESVIRNLYDYPVSFSISKKDEIYYSKQELEYLMILKNYLLFIGLGDIPDTVRVIRYRNKLVKKYQKCIIIKLDNRRVNNIIKGKTTFFAVKKNKYNNELKSYKEGELQYLILDNKNNFRLLIEYVERKKQKYKDVKKYSIIPNSNDNTDIMVDYFKIIEIYN